MSSSDKLALVTSPPRSYTDGKFQMEPRTPPSSRRSVFVQLLVGACANLVAVAPGMNLGFSAVALPAMQSTNHTPAVTEDEASWIASLASIATPIGCLVSGPLLDRFGRRASMFAVNVPGLVGWILLATAHAHNAFLVQVYAGRLLTGLSTGMASVPATVYIAEASDQSLRGMLVTWTSIAMALGILLVYLLGSFFPQDWRLVAAICTALPVMSAVVSYMLPESPVWLANRGRSQEAEQSLRRLRGLRTQEETPREELDTLLSPRQEVGPVGFSSVTRPEVWKPLLIMNLFFLFQQFSGIFVVVFYAIDIAEEAGVEADKYLVTVLIGVTRFVVTIAISYASKRFGRRPLAMVSGAGMTLCMTVLAGYTGPHSWVPAAMLVLYIFTSTVGFLTLPFAMIGEVFPSRVRGLASGVTTCCAYLFSFVIVKAYPQMKHTLTMPGVFAFYGVVSLVGTLFVFFWLPETQGKTLQEVEDRFAGRPPPRPTVIVMTSKS